MQTKKRERILDESAEIRRKPRSTEAAVHTRTCKTSWIQKKLGAVTLMVRKYVVGFPVESKGILSGKASKELNPHLIQWTVSVKNTVVSFGRQVLEIIEASNQLIQKALPRSSYNM